MSACHPLESHHVQPHQNRHPRWRVGLGRRCRLRKTADNDDAANAKNPLTQAIAAAERHANGRAARADYEATKGGWAYDVEVVSGAKVFDVKVEAEQGIVMSSDEDKSDCDDGASRRIDAAGSRIVSAAPASGHRCLRPTWRRAL